MGGGYIYAITFYVTAAIALAAALMLIVHKNPVISALYLVVCFFAVAVDYVLLQAHFLAAIQILLYAGAVLVLFLMIIMLLDIGEETRAAPRVTFSKVIAVLAVLALTVILAGNLMAYHPRKTMAYDPRALASFLVSRGHHLEKLPVRVSPGQIRELSKSDQMLIATSVLKTMGNRKSSFVVQLPPELSGMVPPDRIPDICREILETLPKLASLEEVRAPERFPMFSREQIQTIIDAVVESRLRQFARLGSTEAVGHALFQRWLLPFELSGFLLLAAIVGVLLLAKKAEGGQS